MRYAFLPTLSKYVINKNPTIYIKYESLQYI